MKIKTSELVGPALDWAVGVSLNGTDLLKLGESILEAVKSGQLAYSTDWSQGGPLMDQFSVELQPGDNYQPHGGGIWNAMLVTPGREDVLVCEHGETILVAAMRAIVAAELGEEVDVPDELLEGRS